MPIDFCQGDGEVVVASKTRSPAAGRPVGDGVEARWTRRTAGPAEPYFTTGRSPAMRSDIQLRGSRSWTGNPAWCWNAWAADCVAVLAGRR